jgi:flagellar motility protein MotE (MotC chaperone)
MEEIIKNLENLGKDFRVDITKIKNKLKPWIDEDKKIIEKIKIYEMNNIDKYYQDLGYENQEDYFEKFGDGN